MILERLYLILDSAEREFLLHLVRFLNVGG
jgi:hypothetical protein